MGSGKEEVRVLSGMEGELGGMGSLKIELRRKECLEQTKPI